MVILFNRWRVWGGGCCPFFRTSRDVEPGTPPAAAGGIPAAAAAEHPLWRGAHCVPWRGYAAPPHAMEGDGAEPPPERTPGRATARRPGRATRPTPRRARLGAPPAVTGEKAQGTHAGRPGLPTPAGRPAASQRAAPPAPCAGGGCRDPVPRAARELAAQTRHGAGRTPTGPPTRSGPTRPTTGRGKPANSHKGATPATCGVPPVARRRPGRIPLLAPAATPGRRAARVGAAPREAAPHGRPASTAQRTIVGRGRRRAAARRLRRARREAPPRPSSPR